MSPLLSSAVLIIIVIIFLYLIYFLIKTISLRLSKSSNTAYALETSGEILESIFFNKNLYGILLLLGGVGTWVYQIFFWLKNGEWYSVSLLWPLSLSSDFQDWVFWPQEWIGLHKILDFIPLALFMIIIGISLTFYEEK